MKLARDGADESIFIASGSLFCSDRSSSLARAIRIDIARDDSPKFHEFPRHGSGSANDRPIDRRDELDQLARSADLDVQSASRSMLHDCVDAVHVCQHRRRDHFLRTTARKQVAFAQHHHRIRP